MTPMVDLGFLLITFFIFTTALTRPSVMKLIMPHDGPPTDVPESKTLTILLGPNATIYYYEGDEKQAFDNHRIFKTSYSAYRGIAGIIQQKQVRLDRTKGGRNGLMVVIKPGRSSSYGQLMDILDEMLINGVGRYSIADPGQWDAAFLR